MLCVPGKLYVPVTTALEAFHYLARAVEFLQSMMEHHPVNWDDGTNVNPTFHEASVPGRQAILDDWERISLSGSLKVARERHRRKNE